jgi:serine/threonine-protein kinase
MEKDLNPASLPGGEEHVMHRATRLPLNDLIIAAMVDHPPSSEGDDPPAAELKPETRAALTALGTSDELVARLYARVKAARAPRDEAEISTVMIASAHEDTQPDPRAGGQPAPAFEALLEQHDACLETASFPWSFQFDRKNAIGQGGQGAVYLVENEFMGQKALKVMSPFPYGDPEAYRQDMKRMRKVASKVHQHDHENLVQVECFERFGEIYCMLMGLITGFDLLRLLHADLGARHKQYVQRVAPMRWAYFNNVVFASSRSPRVSLQPGMAVSIIHRCLLALKSLHNNNILHGDIKPSNIMLSAKGCVKLIDIGSAFEQNEPPTRPALSPRYAPPEVLRGEPWTPQGDFASLGYVLIELLTGRQDFGGPLVTAESGEVVSGPLLEEHLKAKRDLAKNLKKLLPYPAHDSPELMELCTTLVQEDPAARFENADMAIECDTRFRNTLVVANMAMRWPMDIQSWVSDAKAALATPNGDG